MIDQWNEQSLKLSQTIRSAKKTASSSVLNSSIHQSSNLNTANDNNDAVKNSESTKQSLNEESASAAIALTPSSPFNIEVELTQVESPFLPQLHLSLPISMNGAAIVIRDLIDSKGMVHPDIGSIIAYALSSNEYGSKRKKMRDMRSFDGVAVNLKTNPTESDIVGNYEHIEVD
ncbi:unnamed protein product, partial [Anisakis simplex]|uniref:Uncharacterized protein n=1 Tax=Anisakis simplex TaxID=6269 RepID=A0A0M3JAZ8_ANISI